MMTDERIEEIFGEGCLPEDIYFARAIEAEVTKPQEPCLIHLYSSAVCSRGTKGCSVEHTTPQPCPKCSEGLVSVTKEDANNYCQILTLLGMEEEGSPVEEVKRLISLHEGMTCGDCNDTGWLENREEGRYPCTCMTEAEPYQLLQAKCADLEALVTAENQRKQQLEAERDEAAGGV